MAADSKHAASELDAVLDLALSLDCREIKLARTQANLQVCANENLLVGMRHLIRILSWSCRCHWTCIAVEELS